MVIKMEQGKLVDMRKGARVVIENSNVKAGEKVLIVTDTGRDLSVSLAIYEAACEVGADPVLALMKQRKLPGASPPPSIEAAMLLSDVIICPTSTTLFYSNAAIEACKKGSRLIAMTQADPEILISGPINANFREQRSKCEKLASLMTKAKTIRFVTPAGTDIRASIEGRQAIANTGICDKPGCRQGIPDIEAYIPPIEDSSEGIIVVDGSTSFGLVRKPIKIKVRKGRAVEITGDEEAEKLRKALEEAGDPNVYTVAEFGIGLNPEARVRGVIIEDESALGTVHIALGDNIGMGGKNRALSHLDMVMLNPIVELNGKVILKGRELLF
jgi:leucyl aminopeptidase (aminopeptidase T)